MIHMITRMIHMITLMIHTCESPIAHFFSLKSLTHKNRKNRKNHMIGDTDTDTDTDTDIDTGTDIDTDERVNESFQQCESHVTHTNASCHKYK